MFRKHAQRLTEHLAEAREPPTLRRLLEDLANDGDVDILVKIGEISLKAADYQAALLFTQRALEKRLQRDPADPCDSIQVLMGKVLYASGNQDTAIQLYTNVLQRNEHSTDALREYAKAYVDRQRPNEALRILLRVLVHAPNDNETRGCLSDIVKARGGLDVLFAELGDAASSGPALAFMATLIKDYGAVEEAVVLYYKALAIVPDMNTYVLNLVHTLEVCNRYQEAMDLCVSYCKKHASMRIGSHHTNGQVASLFDGITDLYNRKFKLPFLDGTSHPGIKDTVVWVPHRFSGGRRDHPTSTYCSTWMFFFAHMSRRTFGQTVTLHSPKCAVLSRYMYVRDWPIPPPMLSGISLLTIA